MQASIPFVKMQGIGNDFVVVEQKNLHNRDVSVLAIDMCHRHTGIGADGLLVIDKSEIADFKMWMCNPDGTLDVCGNGLRCVTRYVVECGLITKKQLTIETLVDVRDAKYLHENDSSSPISVTMGTPQLLPAEIPMNVEGKKVQNFPLSLPNGFVMPITALSTGSTHSVYFTPELPDDSTFFEISPLVENHDIFPERTSLMWCKVENETRLRLRIWERGAGETLGCGTGACAAAVAAILAGKVSSNKPIEVVSKGGTLTIDCQSNEPILMIGPAEFVFEGIWT